MTRRVVYTLHLWPPIAHAKHYTGSTPRTRLAERLFEHATGIGARLTQVQVERGGYWVLAQTEPGGYFRERQLKKHGASRRCEVCKAISGYQSGNLTVADALTRAGWARASKHQRALLLEMFSLKAPPPELSPVSPRSPAPPPRPSVPLPCPEPEPEPEPEPVEATPEINALVDALIQSWGLEPAAEGPGDRGPSTDPRPGTFPGRGARPQAAQELEATA